MPTYDYECSHCGERLEIFQKITDEPLKKCPACKKSKLVRQFGTGAAIVFKGSGFYQTDYRSDSYKKAAESDSKASSSTGSAETKPAAETKASPPAAPDKPGKSAKNSKSKD